MSNVISLNPPSTKVTISDCAKILMQYETERINLNNEADLLTVSQTTIMAKAAEDIRLLSIQHVNIINRRVVLDELILDLINHMKVSNP